MNSENGRTRVSIMTNFENHAQNGETVVKWSQVILKVKAKMISNTGFSEKPTIIKPKKEETLYELLQVILKKSE